MLTRNNPVQQHLIYAKHREEEEDKTQIPLEIRQRLEDALFQLQGGGLSALQLYLAKMAYIFPKPFGWSAISP